MVSAFNNFNLQQQRDCSIVETYTSTVYQMLVFRSTMVYINCYFNLQSFRSTAVRLTVVR